MTPIDLEILRDALWCLMSYRRGITEPTGNHGHHIDSVIDNLEHVLEKHEGLFVEIPEYCESLPDLTMPLEEAQRQYDQGMKKLDTSILNLKPITNRPVKLDPKKWK
jgi:hypothetical protein